MDSRSTSSSSSSTSATASTSTATIADRLETEVLFFDEIRSLLDQFLALRQIKAEIEVDEKSGEKNRQNFVKLTTITTDLNDESQSQVVCQHLIKWMDYKPFTAIKLDGISFSQVLFAAAIWLSCNNPINTTDFVNEEDEIDPENTVHVSDRYQFDLDNLVHWLQRKPTNPYTNKKIHYYDLARIKKIYELKYPGQKVTFAAALAHPGGDPNLTATLELARQLQGQSPGNQSQIAALAGAATFIGLGISTSLRRLRERHEAQRRSQTSDILHALNSERATLPRVNLEGDAQRFLNNRTSARLSNGNFAVVSSNDNRHIHIIEPTTHRLVRSMEIHSANSNSISHIFTLSNGNIAIISTLTTGIKVVNPQTGTLTTTLFPDRRVAYTPRKMAIQGDILFSSPLGESVIYKTNLQTGEILKSIRLAEINSMVKVGANIAVFCGLAPNQMCLIYDENLNEIRRFSVTTPPIEHAISASNNIIVVPINNSVWTFDITNGQFVERLFAYNHHYIHQMAMLDNGNLIATTHGGHRIIEYSCTTGELRGCEIDFGYTYDAALLKHVHRLLADNNQLRSFARSQPSLTLRNTATALPQQSLGDAISTTLTLAQNELRNQRPQTTSASATAIASQARPNAPLLSQDSLRSYLALFRPHNRPVTHQQRHAENSNEALEPTWPVVNIENNIRSYVSTHASAQLSNGNFAVSSYTTENVDVIDPATHTVVYPLDRDSVYDDLYATSATVDSIIPLSNGNIAVFIENRNGIRIISPHTVTGTSLGTLLPNDNVGYLQRCMVSKDDILFSTKGDYNSPLYKINMLDGTIVKSVTPDICISSVTRVGDKIVVFGAFPPASSPSKVCIVYDDNLTQINRFPYAASANTCCVTALDNQTVAIATGSAVKVLDIVAGSYTHELFKYNHTARSLALADNGNLLFSNSEGKIIEFSRADRHWRGCKIERTEIHSPTMLKHVHGILTARNQLGTFSIWRPSPASLPPGPGEAYDLTIAVRRPTNGSR